MDSFKKPTVNPQNIYKKCSWNTQGQIVCSYQEIAQPKDYVSQYESLDIHNDINKRAFQYQLNAVPDNFQLINRDSELLK